jgi:hypothetical protein
VCATKVNIYRMCPKVKIYSVCPQSLQCVSKVRMSSVCTQSMPECNSQFLKVKEPFISVSGSDRKSKRRSKLFASLGREEEDRNSVEEMGSGRSIPVRQGYLYKKSSRSFWKECKKKYVGCHHKIKSSKCI